MTDETKPLKIAMIGSYVPRKCGIATFSNNLGDAISRYVSGKSISKGGVVRVAAMNDLDQGYAYGPEVAATIRQHAKSDYRSVAVEINTSAVDAVSLQHEYGLFGGECGAHLLELLDRLQKPLVSTLHTVLTQPSPIQRDILQRVCLRSDRVVVMAKKACEVLRDVYDVPPERVRMIHHGVPDIPLRDTEGMKGRFGASGRPIIFSFGLLSPGKGIEFMIDAMAAVVAKVPNALYLILGETHPGVRRESGEMYRLSLERRVADLGIDDNVQFHNRYATNEDLAEYLQASDIYVTPYLAEEQITSGTLAYAVAAGKPVVSTPYWHAKELLADGRGVLVPFRDAEALAVSLNELLADKDKRSAMSRKAWEYGRAMTWPNVAEQYSKTFAEAQVQYEERTASGETGARMLSGLTLPEVRLSHLETMTDDTGLFQHALFATPDRRHGYSTDDNARALIVASMVWANLRREDIIPRLHTYLSYLQFAWNPVTERFRNFMAFDRRWMEEGGGDDCQGRVLWALGYLVSHAPTEGVRKLATELFDDAHHVTKQLTSPRAWALSILGLYYYLRFKPDDGTARETLEMLGVRLGDAFGQHATDDWPWLEDAVTYDNARLPQALLLAGRVLEREDLVNQGLKSLQWLFDIQTADDRHLSLIGCHGWYPRGGERAKFDQQCLEIAGMIGACKAAYRIGSDPHWLAEMRRAFEWFLGRNDLDIPMIDFRSRGCYDGITAEGVNQNQGAESLVSWLLSLLIMHEMQTGEAVAIG